MLSQKSAEVREAKIVKGIDISAWQEDIDWQAVKDSGVEFVIIKLGQAFRQDPMFVDHINNAIAAGMKVGLYYYSTAINVTQAMSEAGWVQGMIDRLLNGQAPEMGVWYDVEDVSMRNADITGICKAFIEALPGAGVYSSYDWLTNGNIRVAELGDVPIWCAQYNSECNYRGSGLTIWQYTDALDIAGIAFDGNVYFGR